LRDTVLPAAVTGGHLTAHVGGATAIFEDFSSAVQRKLPLFIGVVVLLAFLLLLMVFRSILIPLTASVMNLLAAGAALGVTVAVFQWGWGENLIGLGRTGPIEAFVPVMLFAILFGLSMDYEVFLVSRIQEEWLESGDNKAAVAKGQAETGRVITAAAAIMVLVFLSFVLGGDRVIKVFGLGLAVAVAIDALLIRTILVPAVMLVLGRANWWMPKSLGRFVPHLDIEGAHAALPQPTAFDHPATAPALLPEQRELEPDLVSVG
jgi:RND superfamily putative drug exporter